MLSFDDVVAARERIADRVVRTPLVPSAPLSERSGASVLFKLESCQPTGSFKVRGAASRILALDPDVARRGVVTASTGNHGRAVAHVARQLGYRAVVCLSEHVPQGKRDALRSTGCELHVDGDTQSHALAAARRLAAAEGMTLIHPFEDPEVIAGQATIGLELLEEAPKLTSIVVPLSGGGLLGGVAVAAKHVRPDVRIIGVSMESGAVMAASLEAGSLVELDEVPSLADSLQGGIGRGTFALVRDLADEVVLIDEQTIWDAMRYAFDQHRIILEGAGAVGIGALLADRLTRTGPTAVICSGANAEPDQLRALAAGSATPPE